MSDTLPPPVPIRPGPSTRSGDTQALNDTPGQVPARPSPGGDLP